MATPPLDTHTHTPFCLSLCCVKFASHKLNSHATAKIDGEIMKNNQVSDKNPLHA